MSGTPAVTLSHPQYLLLFQLPEGDVINDLKNDIENQKIETVQQFLTSYSQVEDAILDEGKEIYLDYHRQLCSWRDETDEVLLAVEKSLEHLNVLLEQYNLVSNNTNSLHSACQQILLEQVSFINSTLLPTKMLNWIMFYFNIRFFKIRFMNNYKNAQYL